MSIAILSDVHGNSQALEAVIEAITAAGCDQVWSLGDVVGYGAEPDRCAELLMDRATVSLAGNHDLAVTGALDVTDFSDTAKAAVLWTREHAIAATLDYLRTLSPSDRSREVGLYHASPRDPIWEYVLSPAQAAACLDRQERRISLVGHSHVALSFVRHDGAATVGSSRHDGETVELADGEWLLNPGSVGQPRDGDPRAAWMELDLSDWRARFHRVEYDLDGAIAAIDAAGLPQSLGERLRFGQ